MSYSFGDLVLIDFPFSDFSSIKPRPALILTISTDNDYIIARVSASQFCSENDVILIDWKKGKLLKPSIIKLDKIATVNSSIVKGSLGSLSSRDLRSVRNKFSEIFKEVNN